MKGSIRTEGTEGRGRFELENSLGMSVGDSYSRFGVTRGKRREGVQVNGRVGCVAKDFPFWALTSESLGCSLSWILVAARGWIPRLRQRWPGTLIRCSLDVSLQELLQTDPVQMVAFDVEPPRHYSSFWHTPNLEMVLWSQGRSRSVEGWQMDVLGGAHSGFGGATTGKWSMFVAT